MAESAQYKKFRVIIEDLDKTRIIKPSEVSHPGRIQRDKLTEQTIEVHNSWLASGKIKKREELIVIGSILYRTLFDDTISQELKAEIEKTSKEPSTFLRLSLEFEEKARELAELPWEYLYYPDTYKEKGFFIATRTRLILTRHVPLVIEEDLKPDQKPLRILIIVSQPKGLPEVSSKPVVTEIENLKRSCPNEIEVKMCEPTKADLKKDVKDFKPHVLHFIGHGRYSKEGGAIALVNKEENYKPHWIMDWQLADLFEDLQPPRLVFLHACKGAYTTSYKSFRGVALQLVYSKIPAVIAMQYPIENKVANLFANKFYKSLSEGKPIDLAVQEGRNELRESLVEGKKFSSRAFGSPVVYLQSATGIILASKPESIPIIPKKVSCPSNACPNGLIERDGRFCTKCKQEGRSGEITTCPYEDCRHWPVSKEDGICSKCGRRITEELDKIVHPSWIKDGGGHPTHPPPPLK